MSQKWVEQFMHRCGTHGIPYRAAKIILRHASTMQRAAEVECSFSDPELRAYWTARDAAAEASLMKLAKGSTFRFAFNGDPRGNVVTVYTDSCRPDGIGVPARGFTSREFDRLERLNEFRQRKEWDAAKTAAGVPQVN